MGLIERKIGGHQKAPFTQGGLLDCGYNKNKARSHYGFGPCYVLRYDVNRSFRFLKNPLRFS